jgi:triosephosphate isomerase
MKLNYPIAIVNFKAYTSSIGKNAIELAKLIDTIAKEHGANFAVAVQPSDIYRIKCEVDIPVLSESIDPIDPGSNTGWILPEAVQESGACGTLINHSEKRMKLADIDWLINKCKKLNLIQVVCTNNVPVSVAVAALKPDIVAVEPPELIGTGISVSKAKPEIVTGTVENIRHINKEIRILTGAGISGYEDTCKAIELGTDGVLLASYITKAKDQRKAITEIAKGLLK